MEVALQYMRTLGGPGPRTATRLTHALAHVVGLRRGCVANQC